ncbi:OB-fold nucleic acid binding domain-containing protein [Deinococcus multiflagellatus]|uniref:Error-prone DNA polymerase n=1 Tax=Deinococcus multiflagellatus TaxID=1656887 RepID=A0ABW1ZQZ4_9DEIO
MCINRSGVNYRAETAQVVRVPLCAVAGVSEDTARLIVQERLVGGKFLSLEDCYDRVALTKDALEALVKAGAVDAVDARKNRREAYYVLTTVAHARPPGTRALLAPDIQAPDLPQLDLDEQAALDLALTGTTATGRHPLDAHRARLRDLGCAALASLKHGATVWAAGVVVARQRPPTAKGFAFYVLEDTTGRVQAVISPDLWEAHRVLLRDARALIVQGQVTRLSRAVTLRVDRLAELPLRQGARRRRRTDAPPSGPPFNLAALGLGPTAAQPGSHQQGAQPHGAHAAPRRTTPVWLAWVSQSPATIRPRKGMYRHSTVKVAATSSVRSVTPKVSSPAPSRRVILTAYRTRRGEPVVQGRGLPGGPVLRHRCRARTGRVGKATKRVRQRHGVQEPARARDCQVPDPGKGGVVCPRGVQRRRPEQRRHPQFGGGRCCIGPGDNHHTPRPLGRRSEPNQPQLYGHPDRLRGGLGRYSSVHRKSKGAAAAARSVFQNPVAKRQSLVFASWQRVAQHLLRGAALGQRPALVFT